MALYAEPEKNRFLNSIAGKSSAIYLVTVGRELLSFVVCVTVGKF